jgi:hypothetical protein
VFDRKLLLQNNNLRKKMSEQIITVFKHSLRNVQTTPVTTETSSDRMPGIYNMQDECADELPILTPARNQYPEKIPAESVSRAFACSSPKDLLRHHWTIVPEVRKIHVSFLLEAYDEQHFPEWSELIEAEFRRLEQILYVEHLEKMERRCYTREMEKLLDDREAFVLLHPLSHELLFVCDVLKRFCDVETCQATVDTIDALETCVNVTAMTTEEAERKLSVLSMELFEWMKKETTKRVDNDYVS